MTDHPIEILLVEDNPVDARLLEAYFGESAAKYNLHVVRSGEAALSFLYHGVEFTDAPRPDVVLLDLHLPEMTGFDVLAAIKNHQHLKDVPVIVLTGSTAEEDIYGSSPESVGELTTSWRGDGWIFGGIARAFNEREMKAALTG